MAQFVGHDQLHLRISLLRRRFPSASVHSIFCERSPVYSLLSLASWPSRRLLNVAASLSCRDPVFSSILIFPKYLLSIFCHFQKLDRIADHSVWPSASPIPIPSLLQILPTLFKSPCVPRLEDAVHAPGDSPRCSQGWWPVSCVADEGRRATRP
jgi:hypothetical protein